MVGSAVLKLLAEGAVTAVGFVGASTLVQSTELPRRTGAAVRALLGVAPETEQTQEVGAAGTSSSVSVIPDMPFVSAIADLAKAGLTAASPRYAKSQAQMAMIEAGKQAQTDASQAIPTPTTRPQVKIQPREEDLVVAVPKGTKAKCACTFTAKMPVQPVVSGVTSVGSVQEPNGEPMCDECRMKAHNAAMIDVLEFVPTFDQIEEMRLEIGAATNCTTPAPRPDAAAYNGWLGFDDDKYKAAYRKWAINIDACKANERKKAAQDIKDAEAKKLEAERNLAAKKMDAIQKEMQNLKDNAAKQLERTKNEAEKLRLRDQIKALEQREVLAKELAAKVAIPANVEARSDIEKMNGKNIYDMLAQVAEQRGAPPAWSWGMGQQYSPGMLPPNTMQPPPGYAVAPWGGFVPNNQPYYEAQMMQPQMMQPQMMQPQTQQNMMQMQNIQPGFQQMDPSQMGYQDEQSSLAAFFGISGIENDDVNIEIGFAGAREWLANESIQPLRMPDGPCPTGCGLPLSPA